MLCKRCGDDIPKAKFQCPSCKAWALSIKSCDLGDGTRLLSDAAIVDIVRLPTGPWDACFGGGIVLSSVALIGGAPGAGKSTLSLQLADEVCALSPDRELLYVASEETLGEIRARAKRLRLRHIDRIRMVPIREGFSADLGDTILARKPSALIVDSLPALTGGDHEQDVDLCTRFKDYAITLKAPILVIDHITKNDDFAGLMALQHAVDTLITLYPYEPGESGRVMKTVKNRFGPNAEVCFTMTETGLIECQGCEYCESDDGDEAN